MELEKALEFIKRLADGVDPTTGEIVSSSDTILNNLSMSRGLFNVYTTICDALNTKGVKRNEFRLTAEQRSLFVFSDEPLKISEIADRLNMLKDESLRTIQAVKITNWLLKNGFLEVDSIEYGKEVRLPSQKGKELGISSISKQRDNGEKYPANLYSRNAQEFILSNLENIISG